MKQLIFALVLTFTTLQTMAQLETQVSGRITDIAGKPQASVTVSLLNSKDSALVKFSLTDPLGKYSFTGIPFGRYIVSASAISYNARSSAPFLLTETSPNQVVEPIVVELIAKNLNTIVVSSKKPLVEQKPDRLVVNVDAAVTNVGSTALEVLQRSPGISVDKDGNISLKGKSKVMIMIDGKPSYLSGTELATLLSTMSATQLSQIEIMTNPSAKYDAAGNAGVINIKTKKSLSQGFNGTLTLSYGQGVYPKSNNSIMLNFRTAKFNSFLSYGYNLNNGFMNFDIQRNFLDSQGNIKTSLNQQSSRINESHTNNVKFGLDYFISPKTTLGFVSSGFISPQQQDAFTTSLLKNSDGTLISTEKTNRNVDNNLKNGSLNLNFHTSFDNNSKELTANIDYLRYNFLGNQLVQGNTYDPNDQLVGSQWLKNVLPLTIDIYSGRLDYSQNLSNGIKLESGIKSSVVSTDNVSAFYRKNNVEWSADSGLSNSFHYTENINAAYINANKKFGQWYAQAGLRLENTQYTGNQSSIDQKTDSSFSRNYTNLFPNMFLSYDVDKNNMISLSIGRRIDRPEYQQLNPFVSFIDKYTYSTGNPYLQPQYANNIELSHSYKNIFTTTVNYGIIHDMINETLIHSDSVIIRSVGNIGTRYNLGIAETAVIPFSNWYTGTFFANLYQNRYDGAINDIPFYARQWTLAVNINNQFSFSNGWSAELSGNYTSRSRDEGQAIVLPLGQVSAGFSKLILNKMGTVKFSIRDIFYTQNPKEIQNFQDIASTLRMSRDTRVATIAFVYRFGKLIKSKSASSPTEEQQRVKLN